MMDLFSQKQIPSKTGKIKVLSRPMFQLLEMHGALKNMVRIKSKESLERAKRRSESPLYERYKALKSRVDGGTSVVGITIGNKTVDQSQLSQFFER